MTPPRWRFSRGAAGRSEPGRAAAWALTLLGAVLYAPVLVRLAAVWWSVPYYSYGPLVPLFSALLLRDRRATLRRDPGQTRVGPGVLLGAAGLATLAAGYLVDSLTLQALSLPPVLAGVVRARLGPRALRAAAFPLGFLAFMAPWPEAATAALSRPLQHLAAAAAAWGLAATGVPAVREGLLVHLPAVTLEVDETCNGLRFLLAMIVVGTALAGTLARRPAERAAVAGIAAGLAVLANLMRVTGTGLIAHYIGPQAAVGVAHVVYGKVVYALTLAPLAALGLALRRRAASAPLQHGG